MSQLATDPVPTGNTYDKYNTTNPVARRLQGGFERTLEELFDQAAPQSILDIGCGEGVLTYQWAEKLGDKRVVGLDLPDPKLQAEWETRQRPNLEYVTMPAENLPFEAGYRDPTAFSVTTADPSGCPKWSRDSTPSVCRAASASLTSAPPRWLESASTLKGSSAANRAASTPRTSSSGAVMRPPAGRGALPPGSSGTT